jgi:sulfopyruvate decarboxylase TPP-binding subunit
MHQDSQNIIIETLKEQGVDLVVTLPEEPTYSLTEAIRQDPYFNAITVAAEGNGIMFCTGAALGGRNVAFVTGIAGLLVGSWALAQSGMVYGAPFLIIASYRGDFGDHTGIPGSQLLMFKSVAEPLVQALRIPYRVIGEKTKLKRALTECNFACHDYNSPLVVFLTGEVLW